MCGYWIVSGTSDQYQWAMGSSEWWFVPVSGWKSIAINHTILQLQALKGDKISPNFSSVKAFVWRWRIYKTKDFKISAFLHNGFIVSHNHLPLHFHIFVFKWIRSKFFPLSISKLIFKVNHITSYLSCIIEHGLHLYMGLMWLNRRKIWVKVQIPKKNSDVVLSPSVFKSKVEKCAGQFS